MNYFIDDKWKNIGKGHTAFCILGGPSSNKVKNLEEYSELLYKLP